MAKVDRPGESTLDGWDFAFLCRGNHVTHACMIITESLVFHFSYQYLIKKKKKKLQLLNDIET